MTIRIEESSTPTGDGRWNWSVWLESDDDELDEVTDVAWHLHPTFPKPIRWSSDRSSGFRLDANGWGTFEIGAVLYNERGQPSTPKKHQLHFGTGDETRSSDRIFLSHTLADAALADRLREELEGAGYNVQSAIDAVPAGSEWSGAITSAVENSDAVVVLGHKHTEWQRLEVKAAGAAGKKVLEVSGQELFPVDSLEDPASNVVAEWVDNIRSQLGES